MCETEGNAMTGCGVDEVTGAVGEGGACSDVAIVRSARWTLRRWHVHKQHIWS